MPIVQITLIEGRNQAIKADVIKRVTDAIVDSTSAPRESIRVILNEVPAGNWGVGGVLWQDSRKKQPMAGPTDEK